MVEAGNGKEAVGKVNGGAKPDLVVTDLNMPEMDGITLIKGKPENASAQVHTDFDADDGSLRRQKEKPRSVAGATGWIVKPFNPDILLKTIAKVLPA
ncbi:MAG: Chemotaxis protein CheY homolog [Nitrospira sp.]